MQGHGYAQPAKQPPHLAWLVFLRVLFVAVAVFSIGFLAWVVLLRLAVVTRKSLDWGLFVAVLAADILSIVLLGSEPGDEIHTPGGYLGLSILLITLALAVVYYLVAESRHYQGLRAVHGPGPAYGYPQPASPFTATTAPHNPGGLRTPPTTPPLTHTPVPGPPPQRPAPARIDQVRAELDELSDYLRHHDGHQGGHPDGMPGAGHEGGR
ncbi:hypothetical protein ACWERI_24295 [Streptomyces collinus]